MTNLDYTQLSTDELLRKFVDGAKRAGTVFGLGKKTLLQSALALAAGQSESRVDDMQALSAELSRRRPIARLRQLFEDPDPDVRGWASPQFHSVDPDWASATFTGLCRGLTTREVLAWCGRILRGPPLRPFLQEMTVPELLDRFVDACERCYGTTRFLTDEQGGGPGMEAYNKVSGELCAVAKQLKASGAPKALVPFFDHPFVTVREKAGMFCLDIDPDKAVAALESLDGADSGHEAVEGSTVLMMWRMGRYKPLSA